MNCGSIFDFDSLEKIKSKLHQKTAKQDFWNDKKNAQNILKKIRLIECEITLWHNLDNEYSEIELYKELHYLGKDSFYIFKAGYENRTQAGILIVQHGKSCTYQLGWNSPAGRRIYANNFLLWNAIIDMKKRDCLWFDLGGIDKKNTPGIAKFKRGLGGEEYTLVGEWVGLI